MTAIIPNIEPLTHLTEEQFVQLCQANPDGKLELTARGELVIMSPTGGTAGNRNLKLSTRLGIWTEKDGTGLAFDSSTMFKLPKGAFRSPDGAWMPLEKWQSLTAKEQDSFSPICPDFVIELRSPSDSLKSMQDKMQEYLDNGARLGWLINPKNKQVEIYRPGQEKEIINNPEQLSGEDVLPGFVLDLKGII